MCTEKQHLLPSRLCLSGRWRFVPETGDTLYWVEFMLFGVVEVSEAWCCCLLSADSVEYLKRFTMKFRKMWMKSVLDINWRHSDKWMTAFCNSLCNPTCRFNSFTRRFWCFLGRSWFWPGWLLMLTWLNSRTKWGVNCPCFFLFRGCHRHKRSVDTDLTRDEASLVSPVSNDLVRKTMSDWNKWNCSFAGIRTLSDS